MERCRFLNSGNYSYPQFKWTKLWLSHRKAYVYSGFALCIKNRHFPVKGFRNTDPTKKYVKAHRVFAECVCKMQSTTFFAKK